MLLLSSQWRSFQRRWRILRRLGEFSSVSWLLVILIALESSLVTASSYHPAIVQPPPQYSHHHHPRPSPRSYPAFHQAPVQAPAPTMLTGPSQMTNPNLYYTIDQGNKLVQRQMPQGPGGITAAATNYLLQQLQNEQLQQQRSIVSPPRPQIQQPQHQQIASASTQQQSAMQLLANLTPQQIAALQTVLPQMPRSTNQQPQPVGIPVPVPVGAQNVQQSQGEVLNGVNPQMTFSGRMGPFDKFFNKAKAWLPDVMHAGSAQPKSSNGGNGVGEPKMRDLHRLPKPPKYPLYDLPSIGQATPPPAPIMHPMASLPNSAFDLDQPPLQSSSPRSTGGGHLSRSSNYNQQNWISPNPTMSSQRRSRPVPPRTPRPSKPSFLRNPLGRSKKPRPSPDTPMNYIRRNHGPPPPGRQPPPPSRQRTRGPPPTLPSLTKPPQKKSGPHRGRFPNTARRPQSNSPALDPYASSASGMGYDHPMASNLSPAQSPALGRPLGYDEYMARPSHSFTDDPWNFDPFASQMNQGLHTHALSYNYDPLGMNALDTEANSHLDPNKLSYPGDSFNQDMVKDSPGIGSTAQIGGWDKPFKKRPYDSNPDTELTPPGQGSLFGSSPFSSSPSDPYSTPSSLGSSSSRYQNSGSQSSSYQSNSGNIGSGFLGDALSGGRRGEMSSAPMDPFEGGSALPSFNLDDRNNNNNNNDGAPTIDLDSLTPQQDDDGGLEFTIETSMDKGQNGGFGMDESPQPDPHPLGPMQPPSSPFLSDTYNPYGEQSSPQESSIPGVPYGPNGYSHRDDRREQRYGRRRTRNNQISQRRSMRARPQTQFQQKQQQQVEQQQQQQQQPRSQSSVPEGVQIFNEIIRPELEKLQTPNTRQNRAQLRKQIYSAIRQSDIK